MAATVDAGDSCDARSCSATLAQESAPTDVCDHCEPVTIGEDEYEDSFQVVPLSMAFAEVPPPLQ